MTEKNTARPTRQEAEEAVRVLLRWIGEDIDRPGLRRTPTRVVSAYQDWFTGYDVDPVALLGSSFQQVDRYDEVIALRDIDFESHCEHHIAPMIGRVHLAYLPGNKLAGISKLVRVVDAFAKRLQVQEKFTSSIARCINEALEPRGVAVVVQAQHECLTTRGVHKTNVRMVTSEMLGAFRDDAGMRSQFLNSIEIPSA